MRVSAIDDGRWPLALEHLLSGQGSVEIGELMTIRWWTKGVGADEAVNIEIHSHGDPRFIPEGRRRREIAEGLELLDHISATHPSLDDLLSEQTVHRRYVYNFGKGSVEIARIRGDGTISWNPRLRWVEHGSS